MQPIATATFTGPGTAGADITCDVLSASIIHGRDDPTSQPEATTITFEIWGPIPDGIDIGSALHVDATLPAPITLDAAAGRTVIADDFNRADGPLGPPWTVLHGTTPGVDPYAAITSNALVMAGYAITVIETGAGDGDMSFGFANNFDPSVLLRYDMALHRALVWAPHGNIYYVDYNGVIPVDVVLTGTAGLDYGDTARVRYRGNIISIAKVTATDPDTEIPIADFEATGLTSATYKGWEVQSGFSTVDDFAFTPVTPLNFRRFTGRVTDIELTWESVPDQPTCRVTAASNLSAMGHTLIGELAMPAEMDGERANFVIVDAGMPTNAGRSDSPGTIHVIPRPADRQPALQIAQEAAEDGGGVLWETRDGLVLYADAVHRDGKALDLALLCETIPLEITWVKNLEGLCNDATITYYEDVAGTLTAFEQHVWDEDSMIRHGIYATSLGTRIAGEGDAITRGARLIFAQAEPAWRVAGVGLHLEMLNKMGLEPSDDLAMTGAVLALEMHDLVSVVGMPYGSPINPSYLFIEGWTETITFDEWHVVFAVSDFCQTGADETWDDVDLVSTWQTYGYGEAISWDDLPCHPPPGA